MLGFPKTKMEPIINNPRAKWVDGIMIVPVTGPMTVFVVLVRISKSRNRQQYAACLYDQRSLAQQHVDILNSPMRFAITGDKPQSCVIQCNNISSIDEVKKMIGIENKTHFMQMADRAEFHVFNSLLPDIGVVNDD
jgi:hypothetical protein